MFKEGGDCLCMFRGFDSGTVACKGLKMVPRNQVWYTLLRQFAADSLY